MKLKSHLTKHQWKDFEGDGGEEAKKSLQFQLAEMLQAKNLIVLAGLGTSLCVTGAPEMSDLWTEISGLDDFNDIRGEIEYSEDQKNIEDFLTRCHLHQSLKETEKLGRFIKNAENKISKKCNFIIDSTELQCHETFLRRIARRSTSLDRTKIFTTNYDLCFEQAAQRAGFIVVDGFSHTLPQRFNSSYFDYDIVKRTDGKAQEYVANVFHLYKMHGSIDWESSDGGVILRNINTNNPLLIYPRGTKYETSYRPPFLEVMGNFQISLRKSSTAVLILGFGFNDNHITQPILSALRSNIELKLMVVDPKIDTSGNPAKEYIDKLVDANDPRISLVEAKFEDFSSMLPDIVALSEEEKHFERLRRNDAIGM